MRRSLSLVLVAVALLAPRAAFAATGAQACTFTLGFAALHDLIPDVVGECTANATPQPNGDVQQPTQNGLLVWRKADNWTAFTNGASTWINGPCGVQSRPNDQLLPFERGEPCESGPPSSTPAPSSEYSEAAIWDWYEPGHSDAFLAACGVADWFDLRPYENAQDVACIADGMRSAGADDQAVRFFEATTTFLFEFEELGRVDLGAASSPWSNMGRGEFVFLNGTPAVVSIFEITPDDWDQSLVYTGLLRQYPSVFPWPEYATFVESEAQTDGRQRIRVNYPLQECRACPEVAGMPVDFLFDTEGRLVESIVGVPTQP